MNITVEKSAAGHSATLRPQDTRVTVGVQKRQVTDFEPVGVDESCVIFLWKVPKWSICTLTKYCWQKIRGGSLCAHRLQLLWWASKKGMKRAL